MKILKTPKPEFVVWTADVVCECTAELNIEESDLFSVETPTGVFAHFQCPWCNKNMVYAAYPQPSILPNFDSWKGLNTKTEKLFETYESPFNDYHVIHLSEEGARLFYLAKLNDDKLAIRTMNVFFLENGVEQFHTTKKLLDLDAYKVFRDPDYPLNGLNFLYETGHSFVQWQLEKKLERELSIKLVDSAIRVA